MLKHEPMKNRNGARQCLKEMDIGFCRIYNRQSIKRLGHSILDKERKKEGGKRD